MAKIAGNVMKYDVLFYANISATATPEWALIGEGVSGFDGSSNPETEDTQYIHQKQKTTVTKSLTPSYAGTMDVIFGDKFNDFMYEKAKNQVMNTKFDIVRVDLKDPSPAAPDYTAQKGNYGLTIETFDGGAGGEKVQVTFTVRQEGDLIDGAFDITEGTEEFTEA